MATDGQFYWPSVGTFVAAYGQFFMAANMSKQRNWLRLSLVGAIASGALALLLAGLTSILFQEIESRGDVTNAQDFAWRAVALAVLSVALFTAFFVGRNAQRRKLNKTQHETNQ